MIDRLQKLYKVCGHVWRNDTSHTVNNDRNDGAEFSSSALIASQKMILGF